MDLVKTIATIFIIFHHYQQLTGAYFEGCINFYNGSFYWEFMVELFFLISGFFTWHYVDRIREDSSFKDFFVKKYLRFFPMLVLAGAVTVVVEYVYYVRLCGQPFYYTLWGLFIGFLGITRWLGCDVTVNNPMWYISVLLLCYTIFFLITWLARKMKSSPYYFYTLVMILGFIMKNLCEAEGYCWPLFTRVIGRGYVCFFLGIIFRNIWGNYRLKEMKLLSVIAGIWVIVFIYIFRYKNHYIGNDLWNILCFMVYPAVIIFFGNKWISKLFSSEKLNVLGGMSFNAYLWHYPIIVFLLIVRKVFFIDLNQIWSMVLTAIVVFVIGAISRKYIETPIARIIKKGL